ncbi:MAG: hypothetical protein QXH64_02890 [Nitrososphaeria archaeon]
MLRKLNEKWGRIQAEDMGYDIYHSFGEKASDFSRGDELPLSLCSFKPIIFLSGLLVCG